MEAIQVKKTSDKIHPQLRANFLSVLFFCWFIPIFMKGFKKELTEDDFFEPLDEHESSKLGDKLENAWRSEEAKKHPSVLKALVKVFGKSLAIQGFVFLILELVLKLSQPLLISKLLGFYTPNQTSVSKEDAYLYAGLLIVSQVLIMIVSHYHYFKLLHMGMQIRVASCSLIYRKALRLSRSALAETTIGQMVNLLSNDVNRFELCVVHLHTIWMGPLETVIVMYLMYDFIGSTAMVGIILLVSFVPLQVYMAKKSSTLRFKTAVRTDERVRWMNEIISGIQVIKMYTWEKPFAKLVELTRLNEMKEIRKSSFLRSFTVSFVMFVNRIAIYLCILTYILLGNYPSPQYVFVVTAFYTILRQTLTLLLPWGLTNVGETIISVRRIKHFLLYDEIDKNIQENGFKEDFQNSIKISSLSGKHIGVDIKNATVKWLSSSPENTLHDISFNVGLSQLVAIIGPVGCGKSTLLQTVLKELPLSTGTINVCGKISYASQESWIFSGSVRQNILFGLEFDSKKYQEVIRVCALERDLSLFKYGDRTLVGERGVTLSGGQKARINLARAIYKEADIYLLDDPLSAVDTHVGKQLFDDCISGYLKDKCTVLVTHQLQYLRNVNKIYLMEDGTITASGTYQELRSTGNDFMKLLEKHTEEENSHTEETTTDVAVYNANQKQNMDEPEQNVEQKAVGKISTRTYTKYFESGGSWFKTIGIVSMFLLAQIVASGCDYFLTFWVNLEQKRQETQIELPRLSSNVTIVQMMNKTADTTNDELLFLDFYFSENNCIYIYTAFIVLIVLLTIFRSIWFYEFCMTASTTLHNTMFNKIIYAKMRFFNTNPTGRILNRFSKDMGSIDESLPMVLLDTIQIGVTGLAISLVVASVNPWILVPTFIITGIFYMLRIVFLATSRAIKRLEGTTRSPVFSHLAASLQGLTTIRAYNAEKILMKEFDNHQNLNSSAYYMFLCANRTFGFWLDVHCVIYSTLVTISFLFIETETYGGNVGLAITQALELMGMFQWGMRQWSEMENQMTSVERVVEYARVVRETDEKSKQPPKFWPENGTIMFNSVCLRYSSEEPNVLKNLSFTINDKEKIGIVGRTGAGKSSLIYALFRLTDIDGQIIIDQINIKDISLQDLRSKISIIPQEPVLFSGSLRKNLDPFDEYNDEILWNALEEVDLKNAVNDLPSGLDSKMSEGGSNFSVGQRQLLCLARAIIRKNKILVLDEATANVDPQTDGLIQATIREKFRECTVLTIAHRLHTIMDSDRVIVMDSGSVVEFDKPHILLQNQNGVFYGLVKQTGKGMAENLASIAKKNFQSPL